MTVTPDRIRRETRQNDFIQADRLLAGEEKEIRSMVRQFVDQEVIPAAADHWDNGVE